MVLQLFTFAAITLILGIIAVVIIANLYNPH